MGSTYLELTNDVLISINETVLTSSNFGDARGIYRAAKQAVKMTVQQMNSRPQEWPFNLQSGSQVLTIGQEEYSWPTGFIVADWNSFYIEKDDTLGVNTTELKRIDRDEYLHYFRDKDFDSESDGLDIPRYVFEGFGGKLGVTPSPDQAYTVKFKYYKHPDVLSAHGDVCQIPSEWDHVILLGALFWMKRFKNDYDNAAMAEKEFNNALASMRTILVNVQYDHMRDTRVPERRRRGVYEAV